MRFILFAILTLNLGFSSAFSQEIQLTTPEEVVRYHTDRGFSGVVLVAKGGVPILKIAAGKRTYSNGSPIETSDRFIIASITKQITAAAALKLVAEKKLHLDDLLNQYFPNYPQGHKIRIHHLLSNSSGIFNYTDDISVWPKLLSPLKDPQDLIRIFSARPLAFEPGTQYAYSNSNFFLLGLIIEKLSGMSYGEYLAQNFFVPNQMANSGFEPILSPTVVPGYLLDRYNRLVRIPFRHTSWAMGSGGVYSNVDDLLKWNEAIEAGRIVTPELYELMHKPGHGEYGYGIQTSRRFGTMVYWHNGLVPGYQTSNLRISSHGYSIITLSNVQDAKHINFAWEIAQVLLTGKVSKTP